MATDEGAERQRFDPIAGGRVRHRDEAEVEFNRIVAFSDGVFAIAMTLLVLGLTVPSGSEDLTHDLLDNQGDFLAYGISFAVLGRYWLSHHRFFSALERFDGRLMALNLFYLAWIALVPFTSEVLGDYGDTTDAVVLYAINLILVSASFYAQLVYADRAGLLKPAAQEYERHQNGPLTLVVISVFALSIPVAFLSPLAAELMWLATFFIGRQVTRRFTPAS
ncbi:MAG: TMEM175 family protein [Solirubrobacterales bacterium]